MNRLIRGLIKIFDRLEPNGADCHELSNIRQMLMLAERTEREEMKRTAIERANEFLKKRFYGAIKQERDNHGH